MGIIKNFQMAIMDCLEIFTAKKSDAVIAVTQRIKDILIKRGVDENKITVIPNGADVNLFRPISDVIAVNKLRNKYSINENTRVVMFVGNLAYWQGVEYLIDTKRSTGAKSSARYNVFYCWGRGIEKRTHHSCKKGGCIR